MKLRMSTSSEKAFKSCLSKHKAKRTNPIRLLVKQGMTPTSQTWLLKPKNVLKFVISTVAAPIWSSTKSRMKPPRRFRSHACALSNTSSQLQAISDKPVEFLRVSVSARCLETLACLSLSDVAYVSAQKQLIASLVCMLIKERQLSPLSWSDRSFRV